MIDVKEKTGNLCGKADMTGPDSTLIQLLESVESLGAKLWEEEGMLRYSAPQGIITGDVLAEMSAGKEQLLDVLRNRTVESSGAPRLIPDFAKLHEPFPLTDLQSAYLVGRDSSFELGNISCHAYVEMAKDDVDVPRLETAWQRLIQRHDMLRAVMLPGGMQKVLKDVPPYGIKVEDLGTLSSGKALERLDTIRDSISHQVFDPGVWPLFELRVTHLSDQTSRLHFSLDQLILDGFSIQLLFRDLNGFYEHPDTEPEPLAVSFRDYVLAEAQMADTPEYQRSKQYWEKRIPDLPPAPDLPLCKSPDTVEKPQFSHRRFRLDAAKWNRLKDKVAARGLTPSGAVLAAYADILSSWSKRQKFTLNMTLFNRLPLHEKVMEIIGEFTSVNLLAVDNSQRNSFTQRARQIQSRFWDDLDHRHYSGVQVIRELGRNMKGAGGAAMPVVFTSTLGVSGAEEEENVDLTRFGRVVYCITQTPQVWLDNQIFEERGALVCNWDAVEEIFPAGMLDDMFEAYEALLDVLATDDASWDSVRRDSLPAGQSATRIEANNTGATLSKDLLHTLFAENAALAPDRTAVISSGETLTYGELANIAVGIGRILREKNVKTNTLVAIVMEKGWEQIAAVLGVLYAGAAYLPLDAAEPAQRLASVLDDGDVEIVLTQSWLEEAVSWPENIVKLHVDTLPKEDGGAGPEIPAQKPEDLAYVIYTSGSTGKPKGVMIDHRGAVNTILDVNRRFGVGPDDKVLGLSSLNFDLSVYDIFGTFAAGATLVLPDSDKTKEPAHWSSLVDYHGISIWNSVPSFLQMLVEYTQNSRKDDFSSLRLALLSGDWIPLDLPSQIQKRAKNAEIVSLGGATEASIWSVFHPVGEVLPGWKSIPYGRPLRNQRLYVLGPFMEDCPDHVPGDLYIGGDGLALGYWKDEEKTAAGFIIHPETGERLYRTGDMAGFYPGGTMEFLGREDFQIKLNGFRVELGEIESALKGHSFIRDAVVTVSKESLNSKHLMAHLIPEPDSESGLLEEKTAGNTADEQYIDWRALLLATRAQAREMPEGVTDIKTFLAFWKGLDNLAIAYMCRTLGELGVFSARPQTLSSDEIAEQCHILPVHKKLLVRWLNVLSREGLLERPGQNFYKNVRPLPEVDIDALWLEVREFQYGIYDMGLLIEYMERSCENLASLFRGTVDPRQLLFPEGSWDLAETVYQYNPMGQYSFDVFKAGLKSIVRDRGVGIPLRILEVGAGVGSSTAVVLPDLDPEHTLYTYTDISQFFLGAAKEKFQDYPFIEYRLFDINKPPLAQGYIPHSYDLIIANNVLHNAADMVRTMTWLQGLLDRNGCVLILEQTEDHLPLMTTMEFLIDFSELEDDRVAKDSPFLSKEQWGTTLEKSGFSKFTAFPEPGHPCSALGQHILVAQTTKSVKTLCQDGIKEFLASELPAYMVPSHYVLLDALPLTATGKVDRKLIAESGRPLSLDRSKTFVAPRTPYEELLASIWADILEVKEVGIDDNFFELGGDSLLLTKLLNKMQAHFNKGDVDWEELTLRHLFESPTVAGMAETVARQSRSAGSWSETFHSDSPLVAMKTNGHRTPFFLISDGRGRLFVYGHLREHFDGERPLYGLQVHDIDGYVASQNRIETIAGEYIRAIRTVQPNGPYLLGGFCMGGIIAREMARQLNEQGEAVDKVVLISSMKPPFLMDDDIFIFHMLCKEMGIPLAKRGMEVKNDDFVRVCRRLKHWDMDPIRSGNWMEELKGKEHGRFLECYRKLEAMGSTARLALAYELAVDEGHPHLTRMSLDEFIKMFSIYRTSVTAVARHRLGEYSGSVLIMNPTEPDSIMSEVMDMETMWENAGNAVMEMVDIPGNHVTCLEEPHVRKLVSSLNTALRATDR
ncbi:MAG: amino acid adenylation domain-containing protein [Desulfobacterium sp.]|nr:amino acid adenylation domain-containing protein [Desulfobacterium sp.]